MDPGAKRGQTAQRTDADVDGIRAAAVFYSFKPLGNAWHCASDRAVCRSIRHGRPGRAAGAIPADTSLENLLPTMQLGIFELLAIAFALGLIAFWIWMLVDCATKETPGNPKFGWLLFIALIGVVGAPLYFLLRWLPRRAKG